MVLEHMGIPTAPFAAVSPSWSIEKGISHILDQSRHAADLKQMPLFIKPACEGSSKGIYAFPRVESIADLEQGVHKLQTRFPGQSILIEKYLAGREYTTSILGSGDSARVIGTVHHNWRGAAPPSGTETDCGTNSQSDVGFYNFHNKNKLLEDPVDRMIDGENSPEVQEVERLALEAWRKLECCDVGRVDVRCGQDGRPYVLEVSGLYMIHRLVADIITLSA